MKAVKIPICISEQKIDRNNLGNSSHTMDYNSRTKDNSNDTHHIINYDTSDMTDHSAGDLDRIIEHLDNIIKQDQIIEDQLAHASPCHTAVNVAASSSSEICGMSSLESLNTSMNDIISHLLEVAKNRITGSNADDSDKKEYVTEEKESKSSNTIKIESKEVLSKENETLEKISIKDGDVGDKGTLSKEKDPKASNTIKTETKEALSKRNETMEKIPIKDSDVDKLIKCSNPKLILCQEVHCAKRKVSFSEDNETLSPVIEVGTGRFIPPDVKIVQHFSENLSPVKKQKC